VFQVIFNEISAAEISQLSTLEQLEVLNEFKVRPEDLEGLEEKDHDSPFGQIERDGKTLYRYRASDVRLYFEVSDDHQSVIESNRRGLQRHQTNRRAHG
jgi:mRNA-degrading endonuclease RelE of RelBE toxin-antitoxin system